MIRYHAIISGRVQGVGFRYFCYITAREFYITGWVANLYNGDVEIEFQGKEENVKKYISILEKGNQFSRVENIDLKEIPIISEKVFRIAN